MFRCALMALAIGFLVGAERSTDEAVKKERAKMKGTWQVVSFEINGKKPRTEEQLKKFQLIVDADGKFTAQIDGKTINESTTEIDPTKAPKTLDYSFTKGPVKGMTSLAIYELKDDTLTICAAEPGKERPTELSSVGNTLVVHKREKANADVRAQDSSAPLPEMKVLERLVGTWKVEGINKVAKWTPKETRWTATHKRELVLDGHFVQDKGFDDLRKASNTGMYTYDSDSKSYRWWFFDSSGFYAETTGTWDEGSQTFTFTQKPSAPSTMT